MRLPRPAALVCGLLLTLALSGAPAGAQTRPYSPALWVDGLVDAPRAYTLADLPALPAREATGELRAGNTNERHTRRGVPLVDLLTAARPLFDPRDDKLGWYVAVDATDDYAVVLAWGEIDPELEGKKVLVAFAESGQPLGDGDGMARPVVPGDGRGGR